MNTDTNFRWLYLPYCIKRLKSGNCVVLNRYYKPLGICNTHVDYELYAVNMSRCNLPFNKDGNYYFYGGDNPKAESPEYFARLEKLCKKGIELIHQDLPATEFDGWSEQCR